MPFQFITAIPLHVWKGSGCFVGIKTLATGIGAVGGEVNFVTPRLHLPIYAAERVLFNHMLRYGNSQATTLLSVSTPTAIRLPAVVHAAMSPILKA